LPQVVTTPACADGDDDDDETTATTATPEKARATDGTDID
jgi:hypothetical protein